MRYYISPLFQYEVGGRRSEDELRLYQNRWKLDKTGKTQNSLQMAWILRKLENSSSQQENSEALFTHDEIQPDIELKNIGPLFSLALCQ